MNSQQPDIQPRLPDSEYYLCILCTHGVHKSFIYKGLLEYKEYRGGDYILLFFFLSLPPPVFLVLVYFGWRQPQQ